MPKVLLIGWDGAGWPQINPLLDSDAMPNLDRLVERGIMGDLATLKPLCPPLLWTSLATGQFADRHGVLDAVEPDPLTGGIRPVTRASLQAAPVWEILAREGLACRSVGWPVTHPAAPPAVCISDGFAHGVPRSIFPPSLEPRIAPLRFDPQEWTGNDLRLFVSELERVNQDQDKRLAHLAVLLAEAASVHAAATALLEIPADFTAVWFGVIGRACTLFPPNTDEVYREAVSGVYRFLDLLLGRLLGLAGDDATVILVSDRPAGGGSHGLLCAAGPSIQADGLTFGAGLLDIAPTILALFGFAPSAGMKGRAIRAICDAPPTRSVQPSSVAHPRTAPAPPPDLRELEALGYSDTVAAARLAGAEAAARRRDFHVAQVLLHQGRIAESVPLLEALVERDSSDMQARMHLGHAYFQSARFAECRAICEDLLAAFPSSPVAPLARAHLAISEGDYQAAQRHLAAGRDQSGVVAALDTAVGNAYLLLEKWDAAAAAFRSAIESDASLASAHEGLARSLVELHRDEEAAEEALEAVGLRYDVASAHHVLGRALRALGHEEAAAGAFRVASELEAVRHV